MTTFDDLTYTRTIMADREREAGRMRLAHVARAVASCCESRMASLRRLIAPRRDTTAGCDSRA